MSYAWWGTVHPWVVWTSLALACVTVVTRSFFYLSEREWEMPPWVVRGLQYAPIAALAAVVVPEIVTTQGHVIYTLQDARLYAVAVGLAFYVWRKGRGQAVLGTIVVGMAVYLPLHIGWGW